MGKTYCGSCRGERGCKGCDAVGTSVVYTGLTEFFAERMMPGAFGGNVTAYSECKESLQSRELLLAADLGTTTLAFVCADGCGRVLASYGCENPQRKTAADVIGRIDAALHGHAELLEKEIKEALVRGFLFVLHRGEEVLRKEHADAEASIIRIAIAGNTTMQHLLMGYPVDGLAKAPFVPYKTEKEECKFWKLFGKTDGYDKIREMLRQAEVTVFPCMSAFVGGDVVAGANVVFSDGVNETDRTELLIDLGTNGELLLWAQGNLYGTAAAMGSAFEGGRYAYASDLFRKIATAAEQGVMDETGLLCEPYFTEGFDGLLQEDVREFQLAKGAIRAGIELLCRYAKVSTGQIYRIFLAGGFGQFCKEEDLVLTGLLPAEFAGKITVVGNGCIGGLLSYLKNRESVIYCKGEVLNLAEQPEFEALYYRYMNFE